MGAKRPGASFFEVAEAFDQKSPSQAPVAGIVTPEKARAMLADPKLNFELVK